jgi:transcriptional regulator with XRE-family HTH domain
MSSSLTPSRNRLGDALRTLMERRDITGLSLAEKIGVSPTSISRILNGVSRPRQGTLTKLIEALCVTPDEQQIVLSGYSGLPDLVDEEPVINAPIGGISAGELDRVARYLELKTLSIDFRESVARTLADARLTFESYARNGNVVTDFLIASPIRTAIECKFNVNRDWEREICTAQLLRQQLPCERVFIVVPYLNPLGAEAAKLLRTQATSVVTIQELGEAVHSLFTEAKE